MEDLREPSCAKATLRDLLDHYRASGSDQRTKGTYFERFTAAYLENDPVQREQFSKVQTFAEWANEHGWDARDTGIDLVAKLRGEDGYAAVQCKFYQVSKTIRKEDIDSFISASGKDVFKRRLIIDTTVKPWSDHARQMIAGQAIPIQGISLHELEASPIQWETFLSRGEVVLSEKKTLRPFQREALEAVREGLQDADRGKLIMACGTGKTFTSLKIAEDLAGAGKRVLFLVPSLALMSQTVREWAADADVALHSVAVCSDAQVGKRRKDADDVAEIEITDLAFPATTNAVKLADGVAKGTPEQMTVVFATYQSIQVITEAQRDFDMPEFDLVISDEAHRTTGATAAGEEDSNFVRVHSNDHVRARKRLYMTATPRIYSDVAKSKADDLGAEVASMDNPQYFGETLFHRGFSWAVQNGLLTDYKVIVLAMDEGLVSESVQKRLNDDGNELRLDDATKIIGCYKALTKADMKADLSADPHPMRRALAFCKDIRSSKLVRDEFSSVVDEFIGIDPLLEPDDPDRLRCEIEHVDGTFGAKERGALLDWLKADSGNHVCRILTNARCLSEGVDVPALDAIIFLHPRKSQIDVVQSVGRVMRRAEGKRMGYVILPVGVPSGVPPEQALNDNDKYRVVWQILNALRAHDDRFDATINKASLGQDVSDHIEIVGVSGTDSRELEAVTAVVDDLPSKSKPEGVGIGKPGGDAVATGDVQSEMVFSVDEFSRAIMAKIVKRCGTRDYWEDWAVNIAEIAKNHITRLKALLKAPDTPAREAFDAFLAELRDDLNDSLTEDDAVEMLAQHIITRPVFEVLFEGHRFTAENPVSRAMQRVLEVIDEANLDKESRDLDKFYASVRMRSQGITDPQAKQRLIVELYDKFFRKAFPRTTEKLGIVYTPVEVVDFILHSVNEMLQEHFGQTLGSHGVHIMDPFTGTGTFITRLLQSGLIAPEELEHKYRHEIHANEIVLLAYYIAAINIEAVYQGLTDSAQYVPFEGICLTDTFQMYEGKDELALYMPDNSERRTRQKELDIRVIVGNPPYSAGQTSDNDSSANVKYTSLDDRIRETYAARSTGNPRSLYDSYIRAIRWASDRIGDQGIVAFVSNAGWVEGKAADGIRRCLHEEFSDLYVFHMRGNQRTTGERSKREGGQTFGSGSRAPISINILVKKPNCNEESRIWFHDIGDYLTREQKLSMVRDFGSLIGVRVRSGWTNIRPNNEGDWLNQRDKAFEKFIKIGEKRTASLVLFENYSNGVKTNRDAWVYSSSKAKLQATMQGLISFYESCLDNPERPDINDPTKMSWSYVLRKNFSKGKREAYRPEQVRTALYRPFQKMDLYYDGFWNENRYAMLRQFPETGEENLVISLSAPGYRASFSAIMIDQVPSLHAADRDGAQCFPLYVYDQQDEEPGGLFEDQSSGLQRRDAITDAGLAHFQAAYPSEAITKEDIFYYVYGLLHSPDYRDRYADNLTKELPRIPCVKTYADFRAFADAGRRLGDLHVNYETVEPYPVTYKQGTPALWQIEDPKAFYRVTKMKFGGKARDKDKSTVIYNANITMTDIPLDAYDYVVNGKPALEWVMERQVVKTDKASGIVNDANDYANETMGDPAYPLDLFRRVITVSLETMKIVRALPALELPGE